VLNIVKFWDFGKGFAIFSILSRMTTSAMLMQEIETLPEEAATEVLDFVVFLKKRRKMAKTAANGISIENAYGIFKGIDTHFERDEEDRV